MPLPPPLAGRCLVLPDDIGSDDIIHPDYLAFDLDDPEQRRILASYALINVLPEREPLLNLTEDQSRYTVICAGANFGHGSARAHAPIALSAAGIRAVVARSFAPSFLRTAVNTGSFHVLIPTEFDVAWPPSGSEIELRWHPTDAQMHMAGSDPIGLEPPGVTTEIVQAGGLLPYLAASHEPLP